MKILVPVGGSPASIRAVKIPMLARVVLGQLLLNDRKIEWASTLTDAERLLVGASAPTPAAPESTTILRTLDLFRKTPVHTAIVVDEFGTLQGIVTRTDLLEAVAGDLPKIDVPPRPKVTQREDGSYLIDAFVPFSDVARLIGVGEPPSGDYTTLAAFILAQLHELPKPGDHLVWAGWRFEVVDMDGPRIDMVLVQRQPEH